MIDGEVEKREREDGERERVIFCVERVGPRPDLDCSSILAISSISIAGFDSSERSLSLTVIIIRG